MFARAWALKVRFVLALPGKLVLADRLGFRFSVVLVPDNSAFACCSLEISASISVKMSCIFMNPPVLRITHRVNVNSAPFHRFSSTAVPWEKQGSPGCNSPDRRVGQRRRFYIATRIFDTPPG